MNSRWSILALSSLLLARPAAAEPAPLFAWDLSVAPATSVAGSAGEPCLANPYALFRRGCADELNVDLERSNTQRLSTLDQLVLLADRYKSLNLDTDVEPNTKLKFTIGLINLYQQDAQARLTLRIRF
jgi:hypothetical protein